MFALAVLLWTQSPDSALVATFTTLRGASARFRQDIAQASPQLVLARAAQVHVACSGARLKADSLAPHLARNPTAQTELAALRRALGACQRDWDTKGRRANADSLRAWGPFRLTELDRALRRYQRTIPPRGTPAK